MNLIKNRYEEDRLFFFFLMLFACNTANDNKELKYITEFPQTVDAILQEDTVEQVLSCVGDMQIVNNMLITIDLKEDVFFQFFRLPELKHMDSQIHRGGGPEEESDIFPYIFPIEEDTFAYRTLLQVKKVFYDSEDRKLKNKETITLPANFVNLLNFAITSDAIYSYDMIGQSEQEFVKYDFESKKMEDFGSRYPIVNINIKKEQRNMIFTKIMTGHHADGRLAIGYDKFPLMRIYDVKNEIIAETMYDNRQKEPIPYLEQSPRLTDFEDLTINYLKMKSTDKYIYALYSGKTPKELKGKYDYCSEVHVWDWNGNPIVRFILNKNMSAFAVSPDDSFLLFYSITQDDRIYRYDIDEKITKTYNY